MRLPGSQPHRLRRPRRPILPLPDSTPQQTLLSPPCRPDSAVEPIGTLYARPAPARSPARSPPAPKNPLLEFSSFSSLLFFVRRGQMPSSLHATEPTLNGQAVETFKSYLSDEAVESSVVLIRSSAARCGIAHAEALGLRSGQADATGPLAQRGLQFSCATCLTNDSRDGPVFRPPQGTHRPRRGLHRVRRGHNDRATFCSLCRALSRTRKIPLVGCRFAQPGIRRLGYASPQRRRSRVSATRERRLTHPHGDTLPRRHLQVGARAYRHGRASLPRPRT